MLFTGIDDIRRRATRRLPRLFSDYVEGGSHGEATLAANRAAFGRYTIVPRCLRDVSSIDLRTECLGMSWGAPFMLAPLGFAGMMWHDGERFAAEIASAMKIPFGISTFSIAPMEDLARVSNAEAMAQIYVFRDRALTRNMLDRARACGIGSIILTVDTPVTPLRERDARNGFRRRSGLAPAQILSMALHPRWSLRMAAAGKPRIGNLEPYRFGRNLMEQARHAASQIDPTLTWRDLEWLRGCWDGKLIVKGVMEAEDARACIAAGADGIIVSNHGGRQMDPAPASLDMLPDIVEVAGTVPVILDGGVRRGGDVVTALALGASAVAVGRPWAWGLAAGGRAALDATLRGFAVEIADIMALAGVTDIAAIRAAGTALLRRADGRPLRREAR